MSKFLAKLFYRKKVRRFENLSLAMEKIGEGDYREATRLVNEVKPTEYLEDLGLYYFVAGRLALDSGELEKADIMLSTSFNMGFRRASLFVSLGLARARLCRFADARELLTIAEKLTPADNTEELEIITQLINLIDKISSGDGLKKISELVMAGLKKYRGNTGNEKARESEVKRAFQDSISEGDSTSIEEMEIRIALLGEYIRFIHNGVWVFGLEVEDHSILIKGVTYRIKNIISSISSGKLSVDDLQNVSLSTALTGVFVDELGIQNF